MLKQRVITALVLVPLILGPIIYFPTPWLYLFLSTVGLLAAWEWTALMGLTTTAPRAAYLLLVSSSGNSPNVIAACHTARARGLVTVAFVGFDVVSSTAAEVRNPERDVPRGILGSLAVCTVLYAGMAGVLTGMVPYDQLGPLLPEWYWKFSSQPPIFEGKPGLTRIATAADFVWSIPFCAYDDTQNPVQPTPCGGK